MFAVLTFRELLLRLKRSIPGSHPRARGFHHPEGDTEKATSLPRQQQYRFAECYQWRGDCDAQE
jgi:hypothetical protein